MIGGINFIPYLNDDKQIITNKYNMMKIKYKLPLFATIDHLTLSEYELDGLKKIVSESAENFESVLTSNKKLCGVHHELAKDVYSNFFQISLTESNNNKELISLDDCKLDSLNYNSLSGFKNKKKMSELTGSAINEKEYNSKTIFYQKYNNILEPIIKKFKSPPTRIRLVKLNANSSIPPHIDYDPSYSVRIIIPIFSDEECLNLFWAKNKVETVIFKPGNAYFLNTGFKHAVMNFSKNDRYTFMISVDGIKDIENIIEK